MARRSPGGPDLCKSMQIYANLAPLPEAFEARPRSELGAAAAPADLGRNPRKKKKNLGKNLQKHREKVGKTPGKFGSGARSARGGAKNREFRGGKSGIFAPGRGEIPSGWGGEGENREFRGMGSEEIPGISRFRRFGWERGREVFS